MLEAEVKAFYEKYGVEPDVTSLAHQYGADEVKFIMLQTIRSDATNPTSYLHKVLERRKQENQSISNARQPRQDISFTDTLSFKELYDRVNPVEVSLMGEKQIINEGMMHELIAKIEAGTASDGDRFLIWLAIYTMIGYKNPDMCASREMESLELRDRIYLYYQREVNTH